MSWGRGGTIYEIYPRSFQDSSGDGVGDLVLQIQADDPLKPADLTPIHIAESSQCKKGQFVITLGNPYAIARDGSACAGWGMLSNIARSPRPVKAGLSLMEKNKRETIHHQGTLLQIDGRLNLGTSGGAVLNRKGELIGIITAMAALDGYEKSVGYAVPLNNGMKRVITELAHGYEVEYGLLGIQPLTVAFPAGPQPTATKVETVGPKSPAAEAGVIREDLIHAVNGVTIYNQEDLMREIALIGPGQKAKLQLFRPRTREWLTKEVTLTKWPVYNEEEIIATRQRHAWNNLVIDYATARYEFFGQEQQYRPAVLITRIQRESPEQHAQLRVGDFITHVNDLPVRSPEEFDAAVKRIASETVTLRLWDRIVSVRTEE
jgi:serine protease Do